MFDLVAISAQGIRLIQSNRDASPAERKWFARAAHSSLPNLLMPRLGRDPSKEMVDQAQRDGKRSNRWFSLIEITLVLIPIFALLAFGYFSVIFLHQQPVKSESSDLNRPDYSDRKRACMELVTRIHEEEVKANEATRRPGTLATVFKPEYCYSRELNTCLYAGGMLGEKFAMRWVRDCFTNMDVVYLLAIEGRPSEGVSKSEFERRKAELMSSCAK